MDRALGIAALGTGEGKTLVALALVRALVRRGYAVTPFKAGPDYLDAQLYAHACGARARNVDLWLDGAERVARELNDARDAGHAIVVEGMMGLFDGDDDGETSTAHVLAQSEIPAILVVDGWRMSQSAAALAAGAAAISPKVTIRGVVLNRCAGERHERSVRRACEAAGFPLLATLPYDARFTMPERHLGIDVRACDDLKPALDVAADHLERQLDLASFFGAPSFAPAAVPRNASGPRIAIADDDALSFTYPQTLDALASVGDLVRFSPLRDASLPSGTAAIWLGGGYPESHAEQLSANVSLLSELRAAANAGIPIYAECGGMMLLAKTMRTSDGIVPMANVLDIDVDISEPRLTIGYRRATTRETVLDRAGDGIRGYEFHYARAAIREDAAYEGEGDPGARRSNVLASFVHRRFFKGDAALCRFVERSR